MAKEENLIQKEILDHLKKKGVFVWRQNNLPIWDKKLNSGYGAYRSHGGMKGVADILGIMPDGSGRMLAIEVKGPKGKQSMEQVLFQKRLEKGGGVYILANCIEDVEGL